MYNRLVLFINVILKKDIYLYYINIAINTANKYFIQLLNNTLITTLQQFYNNNTRVDNMYLYMYKYINKLK